MVLVLPETLDVDVVASVLFSGSLVGGVAALQSLADTGDGYVAADPIAPRLVCNTGLAEHSAISPASALCVDGPKSVEIVFVALIRAQRSE